MDKNYIKQFIKKNDKNKITQKQTEMKKIKYKNKDKFKTLIKCI